MSPEQYAREQERAANLQWAGEVLARYFACDPTPEAVSRAAYKSTECGAWVRVNDDASITFGSIVEGSDAEFTCDPIATAEREFDEIAADIKQALDWLEGECDAAWKDANL